MGPVCGVPHLGRQQVFWVAGVSSFGLAVVGVAWLVVGDAVVLRDGREDVHALLAVADLASAGLGCADAVQAWILSLGECVRCHVGRDHLVGAAECV